MQNFPLMKNIPSKLSLSAGKASLLLHYADKSYELSAEYLRAHSPSAEVQGHANNPVLQYGKRQVLITKLEAVGNYAVRIIFDDGHQTGLYTWDYLYELAEQYQQKWLAYLHQLRESGKSREPGVESLRIIDAS